MKKLFLFIREKIARFFLFRRLKKHNIYVHPSSNLGSFTKIGYGTRINGPAHIVSKQKAPVTIGKFCAIAYNLRIRSRNHYTGYVNLQDKFQGKYKLPSLDYFKGPVVIGNNVWIGDNVIILSGVNIGDGAVIGAGSVVTKNIDSFCIDVGNPARVIKKRFSNNVISQLKKVAWWDWPEDKIIRNKKFMRIDLSKHPEINLQDIILP